MQGSKVNILLFICLSVLLFSCDAPPSITFEKNNFIWSDRSTDSFNFPAKAWYFNNGENYFAVVGWKDHTVPVYSEIAEHTILSFKEKKEANCPRSNALEFGLAIGSQKVGHETGIIIRTLKGDNFIKEIISKNKIRLAYNGNVFDMNGSVPDDEKAGKNWLRFEVLAKKDKNKVVSIIQELLPLLEKENMLEAKGHLLSILTQAN